MLPYMIDLTSTDEEDEENEENEEELDMCTVDKSTQTVDTYSESRHISTHFATCPVCLESMGTSFGRMICALTCSHVLCDDCVHKLMLQRPKKCPLCRKPIRRTGIRFLYI